MGKLSYTDKKNISDFLKTIKKAKENIENKKTSQNIEDKTTRYDADAIILKEYIKKDKIDFKKREYVYHISTLINSFYSTRMGADRLYATAMNIANNGENIKDIMDKNEKLSDGDLSFIQNNLCGKLDLIKDEDEDDDNNNSESRLFRSYSFVTKFLAIHSLYTSKNEISLFPIYDGEVKRVITNYKLNWTKALNHIIDEEKNEDAKCALNKLIKDLIKNRKTIPLDQYDKFYKFMNILSLITKLNLTELDHLFWEWGKKIKKEKNKNKPNNKKG